MKPFIFLIIISIIFSCNGDPIEPISNENIISLNIVDDTLIANGEETTSIQVQINKYAKEEFRNVTLEFKGGTVDGKTESTVRRVNDSGFVEFEYLAGSSSGVYNITAKISDGNSTYSSDSKLYLFDESNSNVITSITLNDTLNTLADGHSTFSITIEVNNFPNKKVRISTSEGLILANMTNTSDLDQINNIVTTEIRTSQTPIPHDITIEVLGTSYQSLISFTPDISYPENLLISPSSWTIDSLPNNQIVCNYQVNKNIGFVSQNIPINVTAFQNSGTIVYNGAFSPLFPKTDNDGIGTITYTNSSGLDKSLPLYLVIEIEGTNETLSDTLEIDVL
ncbi:MAG: hypothetical protein MI810_25315 [Flavobacteriales bacterium]|nr:hypothetical protein [Flavobacteriales bacterium]